MTDPTPTPDTRTTAQRYAAAMRDVAAVKKGEQANMGRGGSFSFRGIDAVMNAVGPAFRTHGLFIVPAVAEQDYGSQPRANGGTMNVTRVTVTYKIMSEGDGIITGSSVGEASDTGDKATAKAMSVALRTFLLQSMVLPTDEPDPDLHNDPRGPAEPDPGRLLWKAPNFDPQTADRATLLRALRQAEQVGATDVAEQLKEIGTSRFAPKGQEPEA